MAGSLNRVFIIGNLGKDPDVKHFDNNGILARLAVATSESYTNRETNEKVENTQWHTIVLRRGLAEIAEKYLKKGDKVFVEGRLRTRQWQDDSGNDRYTTEIIGSNMTMLGGKRDNSLENSSHKATDSPTSKTEEDNDLPF